MSELPEHTGELLDAAGVAGVALMITAVVPAAEVHPLSVTVTLYVPVAAVVTEVMFGFCSDELKLFGPVQLYAAPTTAGVERLSVLPEQTGELLDAVGVDGVALIVTAVVPAADVHPPTVTVTLYVPAIAAVADGRVGFCKDDVNAEGPVQL